MITTIYIATRYLQSLGISLLTVLFFILLIDGSDQLNFFSSNGLDANKAILNIFLRNNVVDQKRKRITNALDTTDKKFTAIAIDSLFDANKEKTAPII